MNNFRTEYKPSKSNFDIAHQDKLIFIGSCFSDNISVKLTERKFEVLANPYGVLFNPISIFTALKEIIEGQIYTEKDLGQHNELFYSFHHHSNFSHINQSEALENINNQIQKAQTFLKESQTLFITFGTAWAYTYQNEIVANCHKIPNQQFEKVLLESNQIVEGWSVIETVLKDFNPNLNIVFTVSPVRHLKDGFEENNLSKAILRTAIHQIQKGNKDISYFPSYEMMMDDLRDYRFYKSDMLHPNEDAIHYIWQKFSSVFFNENTQALNERIYKLVLATQHKARFENTEAHQKHLAFIEKEKVALKELRIES